MEMHIPADRAMNMLTELPVTLKTETIPLLEGYGRVLAEEVRAAMDVPPFAKSPFDGYAFISDDTRDATPETPVVFTITEEIPAGKAPLFPVTHGTAAKILTGAPVPEGADTIIKYEETEFSPQWVKISEYIKPGNIVTVGEDVTAGTVLAPKSTLITGAVMGVAAGQGIKSVTVYKKPLISIVSTGTELIDVGNPLPAGKIYSTNLFTLSGLLRDMGAEIRDGGSVTDDPDAISARISRELETADMVITTGGASVGDYDFTQAAIEKAGGTMLFNKLDFKPGGSMMSGVRDGKVFLGLSGNPGAAAIGLMRIGAPYIRKLCGRGDIYYEAINVRLKKAVKKPSPKMRFLRGYLEVTDGQAYFVENLSQGNGSVSSLLNCDLLGEIPKGAPALEAGTFIKAYRVK